VDPGLSPAAGLRRHGSSRVYVRGILATAWSVRRAARYRRSLRCIYDRCGFGSGAGSVRRLVQGRRDPVAGSRSRLSATAVCGTRRHRQGDTVRRWRTATSISAVVAFSLSGRRRDSLLKAAGSGPLRHPCSTAPIYDFASGRDGGRLRGHVENFSAIRLSLSARRGATATLMAVGT